MRTTLITVKIYICTLEERPFLIIIIYLIFQIKLFQILLVNIINYEWTHPRLEHLN